MRVCAHSFLLQAMKVHRVQIPTDINHTRLLEQLSRVLSRFVVKLTISLLSSLHHPPPPPLPVIIVVFPLSCPVVLSGPGNKLGE